MHTEKQLATEQIYNGCVISVTRDTVLLENGATSVREVVHHNGGAGIVALDEQGRVALVRQFRYALGREMVEIPAGKIEAGEDPHCTAARELQEEAGCKAGRLVAFGSVVPTCGYCTEVIYLYLATGLEPATAAPDADEFLDIFWLPLEEAVAMALNGEIVDSKTVAGLLRAKLLLDTAGPEALKRIPPF